MPWEKDVSLCIYKIIYLKTLCTSKTLYKGGLNALSIFYQSTNNDYFPKTHFKAENVAHK